MVLKSSSCEPLTRAAISVASSELARGAEVERRGRAALPPSPREGARADWRRNVPPVFIASCVVVERWPRSAEALDPLSVVSRERDELEPEAGGHLEVHRANPSYATERPHEPIG